MSGYKKQKQGFLKDVQFFFFIFWKMKENLTWKLSTYLQVS